MIDVVRWLASASFAVLFCALLVANWRIALGNFQGKKFVSAVPFVGGLSGAVALIVVPIEGAWHFAWIPLVIEWGSLPVVGYALIHAFFRRKE